jgi:dihydrodipicolinate synthase/N-acetylneuraminate lyase
VLIPPPLFFRYSQEDLREFFLQFASLAPGIPLIVSNTTDYTSEICAGTAAALLNTGLFAGIEDASPELDLFEHLPASALFAGSDACLARVRPVAMISSAAGVIPELLVALDRAMAAGHAAQIASLNETLQQFVAWTRRFPLATMLKAALGVRGLKPGPYAAPVSPETELSLDRFREWFAATVANFGRKPLHV